MSNEIKYFLYTDGGSRGNPGLAAAGWAIFKVQNKDSKEKIKTGSKFLGIQTNNFAEYTAIVEGLKDCISEGISELSIRMDSELAVNQIMGRYKIKNLQIRIFVDEITELKKNFKKIDFQHVYREDNKDADKMVNQCLDTKR